MCLYKRGSRQIPCLFHPVRTQWEGAGYEPGRGRSPEGDHVGTRILEFPASRPASNKFVLFISYPVCGILPQHPKWTETARSCHLQIQFYFFLFNLVIFYFSCLIALTVIARTSSTVSGGSDESILILFLILGGKHLTFHI